jgi:NAD+ synthase (glutamine-hydrolysing)
MRMSDAFAIDFLGILLWLTEVFLFRFFSISQFKRSALPNGPKISSGGSLSPRGVGRHEGSGAGARYSLPFPYSVSLSGRRL